MRRFSKRKIIYYDLTLVVIIFMISLGAYQNIKFRSTERLEEPDSETVFEALLNKETTEETKTSLDVTLEKDLTRDSKDYWTTVIEDGRQTDGYPEDNYSSVYLNLGITNNTKAVVEDYRIRIDVNTTTYFFKGWCGTFEFHQFRNGVEKSQVIDFNNLPETYEIEVTSHQEDPADPSKVVDIIPLYRGDYFVYIPSKMDSFAPLVDGQSITPGMIVYESLKFDAVSFDAYDEKSVDSSLSAIVKQNDAITLSVTSRDDAWTKIIDTGDEKATEPNYVGQTYDFTFKNVSGYTLKDYTLTFVAGTDMYLSSGWNGAFEIHQIRGTEEKTAYIPDMRNVDYSGLDIEYVSSGEDHLIYLKQGDFFYYYPSVDKLEAPLANNVSATPGMIIYLKIGDTITSSRTMINYHLFKSVIREPLFIVGLSFNVVWLLVLVFDIILEFRLKKFEEQKEKDEQRIVESIQIFTGFIDARDPYTNGHSKRVAGYAKMISAQLGFSEEEQQRIYYIALMHDCGKIGIPDSILGKPDRLTEEEYRIIKTHPQKGYDILKDFTSIEGIRDGVLYHHERYDGKGYPSGKAGKDIPLVARILCVADSVDAMNSDRCYRKRLSKDAILKELQDNAGTQFDPEISKIMEYLILSGKIEVREE